LKNHFTSSNATIFALAESIFMAAETVTTPAPAASPFFVHAGGGVSFLFHAAENKTVKRGAGEKISSANRSTVPRIIQIIWRCEYISRKVIQGNRKRIAIY
jgi:hypothetical protein